MIPYKIHHMWLQGGIPEEYKENYDKWEAHLSGWEHRLWDEESLLGLCNDEQVAKYNGIEHIINRVNYLKYILMYHEGGIYADLDSYPNKDLYEFFVQDEIQDINLVSTVMDQRYPYNTPRPKKPFGEYDVILPGRNTLSYYPDGRKAVLLDNPVLMSVEEDSFWLDLIQWCEERTNLRNIPHEPYGPYGMTDFLFNNWPEDPYIEGILILPHQYLMGLMDHKDKSYIIHEAHRGW